MKKRLLLLVLLWFVSITALLPELNIPCFDIDLFNLAAPFAGIVLILINIKKLKTFIIKYKKEIIIVSLFFITLLISSLTSFDRATAVKQYFKYLEVVIFMAGVLMHMDSENNIKEFFKFSIVFSMFLAIAGILLYLDPSFLSEKLFMHRNCIKMLPRNSSLLGNPNAYGVYSAVVLSIFFIMRKEIKKPLFIAGIGSIIFGIFASGSINSIFTTAVFLIIFLIIKTRGNKKLSAVILIIFIFVPLLIIISPRDRKGDPGNQSKIERQVARIDNSTELRYILWKGAVKFIEDRPFFGIGPMVFNKHHYIYTSLPERFRENLNTHNLYLQIMVESGFIGFIIFLSILVLLYNILKNKKYYIGLPLLVFLISQVLDCFLWEYFMNIFFVTLLAAAIYANRSDDAVFNDIREVI